MRKNLTVLTLCLSAFFCDSAHGQDRKYKRFKVDIMAGPTFSSVARNNPWYALSLEPKLGINDKVSVGLRMEYAALLPEVCYSVVCFLDYTKNTDSGIKLFGGVGFGGITNGSFSPDPYFPYPGFCQRVGLEYQHIRLAIENNLSTGIGQYLAIKLGAVIGGGKK